MLQHNSYNYNHIAIGHSLYHVYTSCAYNIIHHAEMCPQWEVNSEYDAQEFFSSLINRLFETSNR